MDKIDIVIPAQYLLKSNDTFPNNNKLPVLHYRQVIIDEEIKASRFKKLFEEHDWKNAWDNGIYEFHHYHSNTHEVLGIYSGKARVLLGGEGGQEVLLSQGDVLVIPAGVAHKRIAASKNFKCVGAYPGGADYDMKFADSSERGQEEKTIEEVEIPGQDPVYGGDGPLLKQWN